MNYKILKEQIEWALYPYKNGITTKFDKNIHNNITKIRNDAKKQEYEWGNLMINQTKNGNWTTALGQNLVFEVLRLYGKNPRIPKQIEGYLPDIETDEYMYEVKTRNWTTTGTAGDKVFGTMYKYSDIPLLYNKPLKIICIGYQEYELTYGNTKIFSDTISERKKEFLILAKKMGIEYVPFSDFVKELYISIKQYDIQNN